MFSSTPFVLPCGRASVNLSSPCCHDHRQAVHQEGILLVALLLCCRHRHHTPQVATTDDSAADPGCCWGDASSGSTPATPTVPEGHHLPFAGRRAQTAGSQSSKGSLERYMYCLEVQKRAVGGVLASSSTDCAGDHARLSMCSPISGSKSTSRTVMFCGGADEHSDALESVMATAVPEAASPGSKPHGVAVMQRRSKSAYPWLQEHPAPSS